MPMLRAADIVLSTFWRNRYNVASVGVSASDRPFWTRRPSQNPIVQPVPAKTATDHQFLERRGWDDLVQDFGMANRCSKYGRAAGGASTITSQILQAGTRHHNESEA